MNATGLFNSQLDVGGTGASLTLPAVETYQVSIWAYVFGGGAAFSASLPGAATFADSTATGGFLGFKTSYRYDLTVTPDAPGDVLTITHLLIDDGVGANSNAGIAAAAVSVVPEPSSLTLLALGGALSLRRSRRGGGERA